MLKIAVAGCGYWGPNLIRNFASTSGFTVKKICDIDLNRLKHLKNIFPEVEITTDFDDLIKNSGIDAIAIATVASKHFEMAKKSLERGLHTFIEKPMTTKVSEGMELLDIAKKHNLTLMVGHTYIYSAAVRKIKEIIDSGDLGEIRYVSTRRLNLGPVRKDVNATWDLSSHDVSIILYVLDKSPVSVSCQGSSFLNGGIEDVTNLTIDFDDGSFASVLSSWLNPNKIREMTFVGSKKMLVFNELEPLEKVKIYDQRVDFPPHADTYAEFQFSYHYGDSYSPYIKQVEPLKAECQHFYDCIKNDAKPDSGGIEGLNVVKVLEASTLSSKQNGAKVIF